MNAFFEQSMSWITEQTSSLQDLVFSVYKEEDPENKIKEEMLIFLSIFGIFFVTTSLLMFIFTMLEKPFDGERKSLSNSIMDVLDDYPRSVSEIYKFVNYDFSNVKSPKASISSECGRLYTRNLVKRHKDGNRFVYYR